MRAKTSTSPPGTHFRTFLASVFLLCAGPNAFAQSTVDPTEPGYQPWSGNIDVSGSAAEGTQRQYVGKAVFELAFLPGDSNDRLYSETKFRIEGSYTVGQKPDLPKVVSTEMLYGELKQSFDARQVLSRMFGGASSRSDPLRWWLQGFVSGYHNIAFGLESQRAVGAGFQHQPSAAHLFFLGADLRHISQRFETQAPFEAMATRIFESYTKVWPVGDRAFSLTEVLEITPVFGAEDALQGRALIRLQLPIVKGWTTNLSVGMDYMGNAPPTHKQRYWKTDLGIQYSFGGKN